VVGSDCVIEGAAARPSPAASRAVTSKTRGPAGDGGRTAARGSVGMGKAPGVGGGERVGGSEEEEEDDKRLGGCKRIQQYRY